MKRLFQRKDSMKRIVRISNVAATSELLHRHSFFVPRLLSDLIPVPDDRPTSPRWLHTLKPGSSSNLIPGVHEFVAEKWVSAEGKGRDELMEKVSELRDELVQNAEEECLFEKVLEVKGLSLFKIYSDGSALVELLELLKPSPHLAIKVFNWRRRQKDNTIPMTSEEYAKGIIIAGRMKNLDLAVKIFMQSKTRRIKNTSVYNALMSAYMYNGLVEKCRSVFQDLKRDDNCSPTLVTYNILISLFGRTMFIDHMEAMFQEMKDLDIAPNITTYNSLIAGYLIAWKWDSMENAYHMMETSSVQPDLTTHLLMFRGYAHAGNLEKMEEAYTILASQVGHKQIPLVRALICAYSKNSYVHRVKRIEELVKLIPEHEYRPWLNVLLIRIYAQEDLVDQMDRSIEEAFKHNTSIHSVKVIRSIIRCYFRNDAVDRLADFVKRAGDSGWRICRALYHCQLHMYATHKRIDEMEQVLVEMERFNLGCTKKTFVILLRAYSDAGYTHKMHRVVGLMCKYGYGLPSSCMLQS